MFTLEEIKAAHSKVKSGADFPAYARELRILGVQRYETFVIDSHTNYFGNGDYSISSAPMYDALAIWPNTDKHLFISDLKLHQEGSTSYKQFCEDCAKAGVYKWVVDLNEMTCTYYDAMGELVYTEAIPG